MTRNHKVSTILAFLVAAGFLAMATGTAIAQGPASPGPRNTGGAHGAGPAGANQTPPSGAGQGHRPTDVPGADQRPGRVTIDDGDVDGRYVDFSFDSANGTLTGYTVGGTEYFSEIRAPGAFEAQGHGASISFKGDGFRIDATDNPTGLLRIRANNTTAVQLTLAAGVAAVANGSRIDLTAGNATAFVTNATLAGSDLSIARGLFHQRGATVAGTAKAYSPAAARIEDAIAAGHVAARVEVLAEGTDVLEFEDARVEARRSANGTHRFIVDANVTGGRAFVVDFAPGLLKAEALGVLYYDEVNGTLEPAMIQRAASLEDVLDLQPGEAPKYWAIDDLAGDHIIVAVPHFSVHAFDVYAISGTASTMIMVGLVAAAALVAVLAVGVYVGRREKE